MSTTLSSSTLQSLALLPRYLAPSAWWQHVPVAHWLIGRLQPTTVVELGTHFGVSLFSFCEAAEALSGNSFIYGIDTWQGDNHTGKYGEEVFRRVEAEATQSHLSRCRLVRSSFDEALQHFGQASIDLLHIDGLHTYEAVLHDYKSWRSKVRKSGVILFHDTNVREGDFGVWKLWEELVHDHGDYCISMPHGHGLGILCLADERPEWLEELRQLQPVLATKGALLNQLAELRPQSVYGESDMLPYRLQAERSWQELLKCRSECEQLHQALGRR